jgi:branched-chain amino acid transport system substrate-binding protein
MYLLTAKAPAESTGKWDYFKLVATVPPEKAFRPMSEGNCPLVKG